MLPKIYDNIQPDLDGNYNKKIKEVIENIKKVGGLDEFSSNHPYVLKGATASTKYSTNEKVRQKEFVFNNNINTFEKLNIDESNGDRLLIICEIPSKSKLDNLKLKLDNNYHTIEE